MAADRRAGPGAHLVLPVRAGGVRPAPRRAGPDRARSLARPRRGLPLPAHRRHVRTRPRPGLSMRTSSSAPSTASTPRRSPPGSSPRPVRTSRRRSTGAIGTMKGPLHGGAPSEVVDQLAPGRLGRARRGVGPRGPGPRRAADGLRPSRLPRLRPARRRAAQGGRGDGAQARLAAAGDRGRGRRAARPRREAPGSAAQDERRVLRRPGPDGRRPLAGPLPGDVLAGPSRRLDGPRPRAGGRQPADPPGRQLRRARERDLPA